MGKETLFSKNSYDIQLEDIIENKEFNDEAKSLILNILYKIDIAYKDYSKAKYEVKLKNEIISDIIDVINNNCNTIEIVNPKNAKKKFSVDKKKKIIKAFPSEESLLQALYYIKTKDLKRIPNLFNRVIMTAINRGISLNGAEIIRDFNGWSWNNAIDDKVSKYYNIIYQDLLILLGNEALESLAKSDDIRESLSDKLEEIYGSKKTQDLIEKIDICCILIYIVNSKKNQKEVFDFLERQENEFNLIKNKSKYISNITLENNENMKIVSKIENILKSKTLLEKNFSKESTKEKYKTIENYKKHLNKLQSEKLKQINKNTNLINPFEYVKRKGQIEREVELLKYVKKIHGKKDSIYNNIIELQRIVISCFYKKIEVYDLKKELINLIYEIRYYNYLPVEDDKKIKDIKELDVDMRNMQRKLLTKLCDNKVVEVFSKDYNINYTILKYIFLAKMININKILIKLKYKDKKLFMEYYDENALETEVSINFSNDDLNELAKRIDKKIRMFI